MNPELKQRLIGAAVVTALATIFVPMLFDDPVDNSSQSVSELSIPEKPVKSTEMPNKPTSPVTTSPAIDEEVIEAEMIDDAEAEAEPPINDTSLSQTEMNTVIEEEPEPLDTGVIPEAKPSIHKATTKPEQIAKVETSNKKPEPNKVVVKKPEITTKPSSTTNTTSDKTAKKPELVRWTIYAGSFSQKDNATTLMQSLRKQGLPVVIETIQAAKGPIYRLRIGPELDKKKATANKAKLDKQGLDNVMISD